MDHSGDSLEGIGPTLASNPDAPTPNVSQSQMSQMGPNQVPVPSEDQISFSGFTSNMHVTVRKRGPPIRHKQISMEGSHYSGGSVLCCDSTHSSGMLYGNARFWRKYEESKAEKIWAQAQSLGLRGFESDEVYAAEIRAMKDRDQNAHMLKVRATGQS